MTAGQIDFAEQNGFAGIRLDAARAVDRREWERELGRAEDQALAAIGAGRDPLVFTAIGPDDPALDLRARRLSRRVGSPQGRSTTGSDPASGGSWTESCGMPS